MKEHRWVTFGVWKVTDDEMAQVMMGQSVTVSRPPDLVNGPGCFDCEVHFQDMESTECPSEEKAGL